MRLHENNSLFRDAILATAQRLNIQPEFIEKDYWLTYALHLIFHNDAIPKVSSAILEGDYKDRRMVYFKDMTDVLAKKAELQRVIVELLAFIEN